MSALFHAKSDYLFPPDDMAASLDADEQSLRETLAGVDYRYDPVYHQFIPITSKEV